MLRFLRIHLKKISRFLYTLRVKRQAGSFKNPLKVNGQSRVTSKTVLGANVNFNGMTILGGGKVVIGDNFHSGTECQMITQIHNYEGTKIPYDSTYIHKDIHIGDNVWLGNRVMILGGVAIGEGAIIQAGSVVTTNIPECAIAGGHPAEVFQYRDKDHYYNLKRKGLCH